MVKESVDEYKKIFESNVEEDYIDYWKKAIVFYNTLDNAEKGIFQDIIKNVMIDTISTVLGFVEGTTSIDDKNWEIDVSANGINTEGQLQDAFLEYVKGIE